MNPPRLPPLHSIRAFEAVSRQLSITRAANELSVSPSAVSHLVRRIEEDLGTKLIQRSGRGIGLTDSGKSLAEDLQPLFSSLGKAVARAREGANINQVVVRLRPFFAARWLAPRLGDFWAQHPDIQLHLHHSNEETDFDAAGVDFAIEWAESIRPGLDGHLLLQGDLTPVFAPRLVNGDSRIPIEALRNLPLLRETDRNTWSEWFRLSGVAEPDQPRSMFIDDSNVRVQAAIDGQGVELGSRSLLSGEIAEGKLIAPFEQCVGSLNYYLVNRKNRLHTDASARFREWIVGQAAGAPGVDPCTPTTSMDVRRRK